jgi:hypothetical protein
MHHAWSLLMLCVVMAVTGPFSYAANGGGAVTDRKQGEQAPGGDSVITSFETDEEVSGWRGGSVANENASTGSRSYHLPAGATADVTLSGDWSGYRHLKFDVYNPGEVIQLNARFHDSSGRTIMAFEYNVYAGRTTQHVRIDGLRSNFTLGEGIDTSQVARVEIILSERQRYDRCPKGIYIDNVRLSRDATEPCRVFVGGAPLADFEMAKPAGFYLPEFPGFDAGYHTWAIDPGAYQLLSLPGSGRDGVGRALEFKPLDVDSIRIWDAPRRFERAGTYTVTYWLKGPEGATFVDHASNRRTPLRAQWQKVQYDLVKQAGDTQRFVLDAADLGGTSAWFDDFTVCLKGTDEIVEPISRAKGEPTVVTYADGICYVNGEPTFILGFMRSDPDRLAGTPFNLCFAGELTQPDISFLDRCAELGLLTSVNLTATTRAIAPEAAARFARKYMDHPALFSYYVCDEPDHASPSACSEPPVLQRAREVIRGIDPNHPTQATIIPWCASNLYRFRDVLDIAGGDRYAVKGTKDNDELWTVWRANETLRRSALDGEVNIFTPRASSEITREESWAQAYMCIVGGAGGILWFEFRGAQAKWDDFVELGEELRSIEEFLVGVELEKGLSFEGDNGQVKGIGRAAADKTALVAINVKPGEVRDVTITAPFLSHASTATVLFENRTVPVSDGVIIDSFDGLERHVYVVDGVPAGVTQRPVPQPGGPHVTEAGSAWRIDTAGPIRGRSEAEVERERFMEREIEKAEQALRRGDKAEARRIYEGILERYPDAQDIRERVRSM